MAKQTIAEIRAKLDLLNEKMAKKRNTSDTQIIAASRRQTKEYHEKLSKALKGRVRTEEEIQKWRESYDGSGEGNPMHGKNHTEESKKQISKNRKGKVGRTGPQTEETKIKMRKPRSEEGKANMRGPREKKTCPHCGFVGGGGSMMRFHFDNCKHK
jgi:predicted transcriptional regulator